MPPQSAALECNNDPHEKIQVFSFAAQQLRINNYLDGVYYIWQSTGAETLSRD
ncbi:hypothetical protein SNOG_02256 [Parastagonospora nodorum SN15]|uniref:Uncharacterized protein n=2 Tax=Phaeosphaeria nodorum (strain SN15 / ATCC MYA-4574 / FGSC 10173) TaxID=321614 RepID=A0A7U2ESP4_PHANO|nr:hypothetical protein SNOG_02256 [Parastagonospora nodorum SN15]KAH4244706.1 hypothetical protein HBI05_074410 [Parastagonospora nodorum]EAT90468.1 hypothetical protein SNOG_02256 [Parastagonospora nodorum SN15]KAH4551794.1 hypothetical protein HBH85_034310 [Parastagonospora nodorum]KAH5187789.1 hypothetical protein HBH77_166910 [Parastagonospora nodorum]QRC92091.1 hypothetical protein JI435_427680 [Parastagonospora nodorum SN15]